MWEIVSWLLPRQKIGLPENVLVFHEIPPKKLLQELVRAFQKVYAASPWNENWPPEKVEKKLRQELPGGVLVLILRKGKVVGLSWGAIVAPQEIPPRIEASFPGEVEETKKGLEKVLAFLPTRLFYWDEIALLPGARGGLEPIRQLILPVLEFSREKGVKSILFRTTPESSIVRLAYLMGFFPIFRRSVGGVEELYLYLSNLQPFLQVARRGNMRQVARIMKRFSRFSPIARD